VQSRYPQKDTPTPLSRPWHGIDGYPRSQRKARCKTAQAGRWGGLYLLINATGKYWRWKYRFQGKEKVMALGVYPAVSLAQARKQHRRVHVHLQGRQREQGAW